MDAAVLDRVDTRELALRLRRHVLRMCNLGGSSHVGSCLSIADITAVLTARSCDMDPARPDWRAGTASSCPRAMPARAFMPCLPSAGFSPRSTLDAYYRNGVAPVRACQRTAACRASNFRPGRSVTASASAQAWRSSLRRHRRPVSACSCCSSDGECDEGSVWEAATVRSAPPARADLCAHRRLQQAAEPRARSLTRSCSSRSTPSGFVRLARLARQRARP